MTHAYKTGIEFSETLRDSGSLRTPVTRSPSTRSISKTAPRSGTQHPIRSRRCSDCSSIGRLRAIAPERSKRTRELAEPFGLNHVPDEAALARAWRNRFGDGVREYVTVTARFVVNEIHDYAPSLVLQVSTCGSTPSVGHEQARVSTKIACNTQSVRSAHRYYFSQKAYPYLRTTANRAIRSDPR